MLDYIIMGMVLEEALTGYDIKKEIESSVGNFYKASYGSLYPTLKKLTEKDYLTLNEQMQGNKTKKYYKATPLGKNVFLEWLSSPVDLNIGGAAQLARIFFYGNLPKETRDERLKEYEFFVQQRLQQFQSLAKTLPDEEMDEKDYFAISTLYFGISQAYDMIRWFRHIREQKPFSQFFHKSDK